MSKIPFLVYLHDYEFSYTKYIVFASTYLEAEEIVASTTDELDSVMSWDLEEFNTFDHGDIRDYEILA